MEAKQHALKGQWINDEIKEEVRKYFKANAMKIKLYKIYKMQQKSV